MSIRRNELFRSCVSKVLDDPATIAYEYAVNRPFLLLHLTSFVYAAYHMRLLKHTCSNTQCHRHCVWIEVTHSEGSITDIFMHTVTHVICRGYQDIVFHRFVYL